MQNYKIKLRRYNGVDYDTLQITSPRSADEVALTFDDVVLVTIQKTLRNGEKIPTYEVYDKKSRSRKCK